MQPKFLKSSVALALVFAGAIHAALAAPIVATPGSLAGYTYFPAATSSSGGGSGSGTDNVGTLQRCFWSPTSGDYTLALSSSNWYDYGDTRPLTIYYKIAGGDGGAGPAGGGGGSSALLKNGSVVAIGPGGNGGVTAPEYTAPTVEGSVTVTKADTLRFVIGGGGGTSTSIVSGYPGNYVGIAGGGGGAGYTGGGAGASSASMAAVSNTALVAGMGGRGGDASPGAGGVAAMLASNMPGTAGSGMNGGVSTNPNGSSAPVGAFNSSSHIYCDSGYNCTGVYKHPATPSKNGSAGWPAFYNSGSVFAYVPGGGGALGTSGLAWGVLKSDAYVSGQVQMTTGSVPTSFGSSNNVTITGTNVSLFPQPTSFAFTRQQQVTTNAGGALPGQIVIMYQAPVCSILK